MSARQQMHESLLRLTQGDRSNRRCALQPSSTPRYTIGWLRSSSFLRCGVVTFACAMQPNTRRCARCGFLPFQTSNGVRSPSAFVGKRFSKYTACRTASPQNLPDTFMLLRRDLAIAITVLFLRSTTPFCCGVYGTVRCRFIPACSHTLMNSAERNSPPRSIVSLLCLH